MKDAKGHGSNSRGGAGAVTAPAYDGKPTWHGVMPGGGKVKNSAGNPIAYASPEAAKAGADWQHSAPVTPPGRPIGGSAVRGIADQPDTVTDKQAAASLAQGGAKSAAAPVHPGASGRSDVLTKQIAFHDAGVAAGMKPTPAQAAWRSKFK